MPYPNIFQLIKSKALPDIEYYYAQRKLALLLYPISRRPGLFDESDAHQNTPLMAAINNQRQGITQYLLANGVDLSAVNEHGVTALMLAATLDDNNSIRMILEISDKSHLNLQDDLGFSAVMTAIEFNANNALSELMIVSPDLTLADMAGNTALHHAVLRDNLEALNILLKRLGADFGVKSLNNNYENVINLSVKNTEPLKYLSALLPFLYKAFPDFDGSGVVPFYNNPDFVAVLNNQDIHGSTGLICAAQRGDLDAVNILIQYGAKLNVKDLRGNTALMTAVSNGHLSIVEALIKNNANFDIFNIKKDSFMTIALRRSDSFKYLKIVPDEVLAAHLNHCDPIKHLSPLMYACYARDYKTVKLILKHPVELNTKDSQGYTPLMISMIKRHSQIVQALVEKEPDVTVCNSSGDNVLTLAAKIKDGHKYFDMLVSLKADIDAPNTQGFNPLLIAVEQNNSRLVKIILDCGADINFKNHKGDSALTLAVKRGHDKVARALILRGADLTLTDSEAKTAYDRANFHENTGIMLLINSAQKYLCQNKQELFFCVSKSNRKRLLSSSERASPDFESKKARVV